jgi:hypothetical protein
MRTGNLKKGSPGSLHLVFMNATSQKKKQKQNKKFPRTNKLVKDTRFKKPTILLYTGNKHIDTNF